MIFNFIFIFIFIYLFFFFANYQLYNILHQVREQTLSQFERNHETPPPLIFEDQSMIYDIFLHINAPWIKHYCFIWSSPCSTNLVILAQATIFRYYMCKVWKLSKEYFLHDTNFVYNPMGASSTGASSTGSILVQFTFWCITSLFVSCRFQSFVIKKSKKLSLIWYQTYLDMWSIFGVKLNYIVIFEKSCNSSTLLMELFKICDPYSYLVLH